MIDGGSIQVLVFALAFLWFAFASKQSKGTRVFMCSAMAGLIYWLTP